MISTFRVTQFNFTDISADELETVVIQSAPDELKKLKELIIEIQKKLTHFGPFIF